jgi:3-oxoacyl-[acyl-carrier protein] reductase
MNPTEFAGRVALITGGSRGIGRAIAIELARCGADVSINYLSRSEDAEQTKELIEKEGRHCTLAPADVSDPAQVDEMVRKTRTELGPIDLLVANAGLSIIASHDKLNWGIWKRTMAVNLDGAFLSVMAVKDDMLARGYGRIVAISSVAALRPRKNQIHYASAKNGVIAMVRCCAEAFAPKVRINCIAPGVIETEMGGLLGPTVINDVVAATPMGRIGQPHEVANLTRFLLSDDSSFMTGQCIAVSGGRIMLP